jgi:hypothetical protein
MSDLIRLYDFPIPDDFLDLQPFPIQLFCHPRTPQLLFILGGKQVGGLLVIIERFWKRKTETERVQSALSVLPEKKRREQENHNVGWSPTLWF